MRRLLHARLLASALAVSVVPLVATAIPAFAQDYGDVSFDSFHDALSQYGYWVYSDRWGVVWQPGNVSDDFRPYYSGGHWVYTDDYGWYWASDYAWGDIAFHYGRWVNDPYDGWLWIPGYTWSPGWVDWRSNGQYIGWMPAPPDEAFLQGRGDVSFGLSFGSVSLGFNDDPYYGYRGWYGRDFDDRRFAANWVFVGVGHVADRDYRSVIVRDPGRVTMLIRQTRNVTHYTVVNNYVVNRSIDVRVVQRAAGHPINVVAARTVIRQPNLVMRADAGQRIQMRERMIAPRGNGSANSAPPPPASVVNKLSNNVPQRNGGGSQHLFSKTTISNPDSQSHFRGAPGGRGPASGPSGMSGPGSNPPNGGMNGPGNPNGMSGPGGQTPPTGWPKHRDQTPQGTPDSNGPSGMNAPGDQTPPNSEPRHRDQGSQGSSTGGMSGPGSSNESPNTNGGSNGPGGEASPGGEQRHRIPPGGNAGGMNGPANGEGNGSPPSGHAQPPGGEGPPPKATTPPPPKASVPPPADQGTPPPKKKHKPDEPPPGTPQ